MSAMPMTVRIASTRIATTRAAPRSRRLSAWSLVMVIPGTPSSLKGIVAEVDLQRLHAAPEVAGDRRRRGVHELVALRVGPVVRRIRIARLGEQRHHDAVQARAVPCEHVAGM